METGINMEIGNRFRNSESLFRRWTRQAGIVISLFIICLVFSIISPYFFTQRNLINVALQASINAVIAIGMTIVIITAGIDLSVGSMLALVAVITAKILTGGMPIVAAIIIGMLVGIVCGVINGTLVAGFKLQPFLVTLGTMSLYRGVALIYTNGEPIQSGFPVLFKRVIGGNIGFMPIPILIMVFVACLAFFVLKYTKLGEYIFAIGGNEEAARLSGINVKKFKVMAYGLSGLACAVGAIIMIGRLGAAEPIAGAGYELDAIAASAVGGASLAGGKGSIVGTILGALILSMLRNGLTLLNVQAFYQQVATGAIIIIAILIDSFSQSK